MFFGGYPYGERQSDGYFQRVQMVDRLFRDKDHWRIYIDSGQVTGGPENWHDCPEPNVLVLRLTNNRLHRVMAQVCALLCVLKCRKVFFHSIFTMLHRRTNWLLYVPALTKVIDVHGLVPEEFRLHNDFYRARLYEPVEELAIRKCQGIIVVTRAMENYLRQKYRQNLRGQVVLFPMFPNYPLAPGPRPYVNGKPVLVYAGGLQKWQQVPKMIDAIRFTQSLYEFRFYCPDPYKVRELLPETQFPNVVIGHKSQAELLDLYRECHYGFILREDNVVNHAACPTKLVEYLAMGIVPIINTENIGDFHALGMLSVTLDDVLRNSLPSEARRAEMAEHNFGVYEKLHEIFNQGASDIVFMISDTSGKQKSRSKTEWL